MSRAEDIEYVKRTARSLKLMGTEIEELVDTMADEDLLKIRMLMRALQLTSAEVALDAGIVTPAALSTDPEGAPN